MQRRWSELGPTNVIMLSQGESSARWLSEACWKQDSKQLRLPDNSLIEPAEGTQLLAPFGLSPERRWLLEHIHSDENCVLNSNPRGRWFENLDDKPYLKYYGKGWREADIKIIQMSAN